ncbi:hormonally up-regulated neu tumor-associated kinase-like [Acanthaster planci]|uniref:non-specific serine/threonine protein kinase n=1 Tax=Acanthaster planci TaxID=133434 RepID=A0A8B7ZPJ9_ACAPL|nr:hormonally up-regulated neu tumor-associated kinase-like [Acanthaster planci]
MANGTVVRAPGEEDTATGPEARPVLRRSDSRNMPPAMAVRKRVGGYLVGETIGEGSFGKVRSGTHTLTGEKVAMKIIDKKLIAKREYVRKNLRREAVVLQRLTSHPNIIRLYEVLETANNYYLVTEFAQGGPFMRYLCDRKKLSERETRKFMRQLVSAVDYMHQAEVVHRDIKIENFLLDEDSNLKVIDFGLSNILGPDGLLKTQCGSPAYAAPEIFCNASYSPAVDVWSIGVNMYAMLTGELPFIVDPPTNMTKLHAKIIQGCTIPQNLTRDCRDLLGKLLTANETERISLRDVMHHPWINRGYTHRLHPTQFPNRLTDQQLDGNIISSLVASGFSEAAVREAVTQNKPIAETAGYHLLRNRLAKGWGHPEGAAPAANDSGGSDGDDVIDLESDSVMFTPTPAGKSSRPGSSAGWRTNGSTKLELDRAKSQLVQNRQAVQQEDRLKSAPTPNKKHSGPLLIDTRKQKADALEENTSPTREVILDDMRQKLAPSFKPDPNNNEINLKDKNTLIIVTSLDENSHPPKKNPKSVKETTHKADKENDRAGTDERQTCRSAGEKGPPVDPHRSAAGWTAPSPGRAAVEHGCMIIVNGKLAKGNLYADVLQHQRSAWTSETPEDSPTPVLGRRTGSFSSRRGPGLRRSQTDPGTYLISRDAERRNFVPLTRNREGVLPYQNHGAFPAHRLGLYYSTTRQLRHYPGTPRSNSGSILREAVPPRSSARARSHTAPNSRPLLALKGAPALKSAPLPGSKRPAAGMSANGKDLTLPRINLDRVGCQ